MEKVASRMPCSLLYYFLILNFFEASLTLISRWLSDCTGMIYLSWLPLGVLRGDFSTGTTIFSLENVFSLIRCGGISSVPSLCDSVQIFALTLPLTSIRGFGSVTKVINAALTLTESRTFCSLLTTILVSNYLHRLPRFSGPACFYFSGCYSVCST